MTGDPRGCQALRALPASADDPGADRYPDAVQVRLSPGAASRASRSVTPTSAAIWTLRRPRAPKIRARRDGLAAECPRNAWARSSTSVSRAEVATSGSTRARSRRGHGPQAQRRDPNRERAVARHGVRDSPAIRSEVERFVLGPGSGSSIPGRSRGRPPEPSRPARSRSRGIPRDSSPTSRRRRRLPDR
jgi:hypothetical protein